MPLLPPQYLNAVVSIGTESEGHFHALATGFLVGFSTGRKTAEGQNTYWVFLVTNRHVFEERTQITLRFNVTGTGSKRFLIELVDKHDKKKWSTHQDERVDIAVISINTQYLKDQNIDFYYINEEKMAFKEDIKRLRIAHGDEVFVLGFPMKLAGKERNYVIVRSGIIARLDDEILNNDFAYLIDASIFPGNSGGPVVIKPNMVSLKGAEAVNKAYLIGVVRSYITYRDVAVSEQTGEPRVIFTENSGLAEVVPMDFVRDIARVHSPPLNFDKSKAQT